MYQGRALRRDKNPREKAGIVSILFFLFTYPIFKRGIRKELEEDDIYEILSGYESEKLGKKFENQWNLQTKSLRPSLIKALFGVFGPEYMACGLVQCIVRTTFMITRPLVIGKLVAYFDHKSQMSIHDAYYYASLVIGITILQTIYNHGYMLYLQQMAQKIRIGICSLIYRKSLRLSTSSLIEITHGKIVTLITKDVSLFDTSIVLSHDIWIGVIQVALMTYVMYNHIGVSAIFGVGFLILLVPFQFWIGKQTTNARLKTAAKSDERIRLIQEVLSTIRTIKTYAWEIFFSKLVDYLRRSEIGKLKIIFYLKATMLAMGELSTRCSFFICLISYYLLGNEITAEKAFIILGCYGSLRSVLTVAIPLGISQVADLYSSIKRIRGFLMTTEVKVISEDSGLPKIILKNASAAVIKDKNVLQDVTLNLHVGLYGLTGPVGSGKSCLLRLLLDDIVLTDGYVTVNGVISYASQEPWLFPGTIRQNILFGSELEVDRYQQVIKACALRVDFESFARGDNTLVNDRGLNLSKGQQSRINLARAIYKKADIYLLDNPLAPVDMSVSKQIFKNCIKEFLKGKLVIFCTHQIHLLQEVSEVIVMKDGRIEDRGTYGELIKRNVDFGIEIIAAPNEEANKIENYMDEDEYDEDAEERDYLIKSTTSLHTPKLYGEIKQSGSVNKEAYSTYVRYAGGLKWMLCLLLFCSVSQAGASYFDYFVTYWIGIEKNYNRLNELLKNDTIATNSTVPAEYEDVSKTKSRIPIFYGTILIVTGAVVLAKSFLYFALTSRASMKMHNVSFSNIIKASMSFFDTNLSGNILNRFSKDFATIDEFIPYIFFECLRILFVLIGTLTLIIKVNFLFAFLSLGFGIILFAVRHYYLPTSRSLKRLDSMTRSPVVGHLNASLEGLTTIRANKAQEIVTLQFDLHQNLYSSTAYMYMTTNRAFGFFLDMLCSLYLTIITLSFIIATSSTAAENVGLAITQAIGLTGLLQWGIRQWAELENQMTSVERVLEYTKVTSEYTKGIEPNDWPLLGKIEYRNVYLRYPKTDELVLKDISFTISPTEKVGIIGRTGAGKSSIISTLLRLYSIESGGILIDDVDINMIALNFVRSAISVIPQNPVLFSGTLKSNLDPDAQFSDFDLWKALDVVNMKTTIENLPGQLECIINEGGSNFSAGEKQLICLARAVLRNNKILVLDEATANVDIKTADLIQDTIKTKFADCTTLTIAHRLHSVMKSDRVMVVSDGMVVEFDTPKVLMEDTESKFYQMVSQGNWEADS